MPNISRLVATIIPIAAMVAGLDALRAVSPAEIQQGRILFEKTWSPQNPRLGGDGLGPLFNATACTTCHRDGGVGGSGDATVNVKTLGIEWMRIDGGGLNSDKINQITSLFHPGFVTSNGVLVNTFTIPHRGGSEIFRHRTESLLNQVPAQRSESGGVLNSEEVRRSFATPILFHQTMGGHSIRVRARLFQRNTPALFGAGLIEQIKTKDIEAQFRAQKQHPEISGRPATLKDGRVGRFGWRGNVATLVEFVDQACAHELGLETRRKRQPNDPTKPDYRNPTIDISDEAIEAMTAFVAQLPPPTQRTPTSTEENAEIVRGRQVFDSVGCAICHVPNLGGVPGIYSDLLLHEMGDQMVDLNHAEPYLVRYTPEYRRDFTRLVRSEGSIESTQSSSSDNYGGTTRVEQSSTRTLNFEAPEYPEQKMQLTDVYRESSLDLGSGQSESGGISDSNLIRTDRWSVRALVEPTRFNQEWRTPPLWGVKDSAPYLHDGRAATLLEAITMHEGEATGTRDRFLNLPLPDRHAVIAFLETLVAPPNVPQTSL